MRYGYAQLTSTPHQSKFKNSCKSRTMPQSYVTGVRSPHPATPPRLNAATQFAIISAAGGRDAVTSEEAVRTSSGNAPSIHPRDPLLLCNTATAAEKSCAPPPLHLSALIVQIMPNKSATPYLAVATSDNTTPLLYGNAACTEPSLKIRLNVTPATDLMACYVA